MAYYYSGNVQSEIATICHLIGQLVQQASDCCALDEESRMDLRLVLSELMINGCEHGNQNNRNKLVMLDLFVSEEEIDIRVQDEGCGFYLDLTPDAARHLDCGGRGLRIVSRLVDEMSVKENRVHCVIRLHHAEKIAY